VPVDSDARSPISASDGQRPLALDLLISLRPRQWTKNGLVFLAILFSLNLTNPNLVLRAVLAFVGFCVLASATYVVNDLFDQERDRQHPTKRKRPIASGQVSRGVALVSATVLLAASLSMAAGLGSTFLLVALLYMVLSFSYTLRLKHMVIIDVLALAAGFVLRAAAGAVAIDVPISPWLYVCTALGALFIAFAKRRQEIVLLQESAADHRQILQEYTIPLLDQMISVVASATVIAYSLYTFSAEYLPKNQSMMLTIPFLLYGIFRYLYLVHVKGVGGSPEEVLLTDRPLQATVLGWGLTATVILYQFQLH
jgi:4-hydroxybenzoate polyprenyltransferase